MWKFIFINWFSFTRSVIRSVIFKESDFSAQKNVFLIFWRVVNFQRFSFATEHSHVNGYSFRTISGCIVYPKIHTWASDFIRAILTLMDTIASFILGYAKVVLTSKIGFQTCCKEIYGFVSLNFRTMMWHIFLLERRGKCIRTLRRSEETAVKDDEDFEVKTAVRGPKETLFCIEKSIKFVNC